MRSLGLVSQILTIIIAIAIAVFYVMPTFDEVKAIQNEISDYQTEQRKIEIVNTLLANHIATLASVSPQEKRLADVYMPQVLDDISVMRDIEYIVGTAGLTYSSLEYTKKESQIAQFGSTADDESEPASALGDLAPTPHTFVVTVTGSYTNMKQFFRLLEQNNYPLEVHNVELANNDQGDLVGDITLVTYANEPILVNE